MFCTKSMFQLNQYDSQKLYSIHMSSDYNIGLFIVCCSSPFLTSIMYVLPKNNEHLNTPLISILSVPPIFTHLITLTWVLIILLKSFNEWYICKRTWWMPPKHIEKASPISKYSCSLKMTYKQRSHTWDLCFQHLH